MCRNDTYTGNPTVLWGLSVRGAILGAECVVEPASLHTRTQNRTCSLIFFFFFFKVHQMTWFIWNISLRANFRMERHRNITPQRCRLKLCFNEQKEQDSICCGLFKFELKNIYLTLCMKTITCVEFFENFMLRKFRIQVCYVADVPNAITKATDLEISLGEGLDVLDFLSPI